MGNGAGARQVEDARAWDVESSYAVLRVRVHGQDVLAACEIGGDADRAASEICVVHVGSGNGGGNGGGRLILGVSKGAGFDGRQDRGEVGSRSGDLIQPCGVRAATEADILGVSPANGMDSGRNQEVDVRVGHFTRDRVVGNAIHSHGQKVKIGLRRNL